jgi:hypothetical protein
MYPQCNNKNKKMRLGGERERERERRTRKRSIVDSPSMNCVNQLYITARNPKIINLSAGKV